MRTLIGFLLISVVFSTSCQQHSVHAGHGRHRFDDVKTYASRLEDSHRAEWQKPEEVIRALGLQENAWVADLGAGTGYFSVRLAAQLPLGRVLALDVEPAMTKYVLDRARHLGLSNLDARTIPASEPALPFAVDCVLLVNTWHHLENRVDYAKKLATFLKPQGRVALVDFLLEAPEGPPRDMRLAPETVEAEFQAAGFVKQAQHDFLPRQYFLVFTPNST